MTALPVRVDTTLSAEAVVCVVGKVTEGILTPAWPRDHISKGLKVTFVLFYDAVT